MSNNSELQTSMILKPTFFLICMQQVAPYERPTLTKAYLFPPDKGPARLPVCAVGCFSAK
jgi:hypothetical protein